jgi:membrane-associated phospholipid phosphatase
MQGKSFPEADAEVGLAAGLSRRLGALLRLKVGLTIGLNLLFWLGYGSLSRHALFTECSIPLTWLDRAVPFAPRFWAWVYLSQFAITGGLPWLIDSRAVLGRYVVGLAVLSGVSFMIFLFWPVASPRPADLSDAGPMWWIARGDGPYNAFPSLHAGFLVFMGGMGWRMFPARPNPALCLLFLTWSAAILYSTLATRQHYALDLVAGGVIGLVADRVAWAGFTGVAAHKTFRNSGAMSHDG